MDIRHPLKDSDRDMIELCNNSDIAFIPVLTKSDKLSNNQKHKAISAVNRQMQGCLLYTSPSPRDVEESRMPSSA